MWCWERGRVVAQKCKATGSLKSSADYPECKHDDDSEIPAWPTGSVAKSVVLWPTFLNYWKQKHPNIKIRNKGADTCKDCQVWLNELWMRALAAAEEKNDDDIEMQVEDVARMADDKTMADNGTTNNGRALEGEIRTVESILDKAKDHVNQYQCQRKRVKQIIANACIDVLNKVIPSALKQKVITIDMGQNLNLPNFLVEQPGDTYYLLALTIYLVGIVDNASFDETTGKFQEKMTAYVWKEGEADCGANNICLCLLKHFQKQGWLHHKINSHSELTIIADNCGGQNKNKHAVQFLMWLVEAGYFAKIELFFLVKGHTKNACDRMFNLVKLGYHKKTHTHTHNY